MRSTRRARARKTREGSKARRDTRSRKRHRNRRKDRRSRRNRRGSRGIRKGGFFSKGIDQDMFDTWQRNNPELNDCCPCVFGFLGLPEKTVQNLKRYFETWRKGMGESEIEGVFRLGHPDYDFQFVRSPELANPGREEKLDAIIKGIDDYVPVGRATVGGIQWCGGPGMAECSGPEDLWRPRHCFLIGKNEDGILYLADVQSEEVYTGINGIKGWLMHPPGMSIGSGGQTEYLWILHSSCKRKPCARDSGLLGNPLTVVHPYSEEQASARGQASMEID